MGPKRPRGNTAGVATYPTSRLASFSSGKSAGLRTPRPTKMGDTHPGADRVVMPQRPPRRCTQTGCRETINGRLSRCPDHAIQDTRASAHHRGYGSEWKRLRAICLKQNPYCVACAERGELTRATDLDHIIPRSQGGTDDPSNLQPTCHPCHSRKTAARDGGFGNPTRPYPPHLPR